MKRGDIIILLICLAVAGLLFLPRLTLPPASKLLVTSSGGQLEFPLQDDFLREIDGVVIEIKGMRARVVSSPCRDQLCVRAGWLSRPGDTAVCLPRRVAIQIKGGQSGVDSVAY